MSGEAGPVILATSDDLTGAAACAGELCSAGLRACVARVLGSSLELPGTPVPDALVLDTATRLASPEAAVQRTYECWEHTRRMVAQGALVYRRIDSGLRGPWCQELATWLQLQSARAVLAVAAPQNRVVTREGRQWVANQPLGTSHYASDQGAPPTDDLVALLTGVIDDGVAQIGLEDVRGGAAALEAHLDAVLRQHRLAVVDGETEDDLALAARAAVALARQAPTVIVGSYGLGRFVGAHCRTARPILVVAGSVKDCTLDQLQAAAASGVTVIEVPVVLEGDPTQALLRCASQLQEALAVEQDVVLSTATSRDAIQPDPHRGQQQMELLQTLVSRLPTGLYAGLIVIGGETAGGLFEALGVREFAAQCEPWPAIPLLTIPGEHELPVILKSGSWGGSSWITEALQVLHRKVDTLSGVDQAAG